MSSAVLRLFAAVVVAIALFFAGALLPRYLGYLESQTAYRACLNVAELMFRPGESDEHITAQRNTFLLTCMATRVTGTEVKLQ